MRSRRRSGDRSGAWSRRKGREGVVAGARRRSGAWSRRKGREGVVTGARRRCRDRSGTRRRSRMEARG